jgi:dynein heavy chain
MHLDRLFAFSFTYGLGAALDEKSKDQFDTCVRDIFKAVQYPAGQPVFDFFYDMKKGAEWLPWDNRVPTFQFSKEKSFFDLMVETSTTYRHGWCLETLLEGNYSSFFTGDSGVGKSVIVANTFNKLVEKGTYQGIYLNFSAQTDSKRTQVTIMEKLEKISRTTLGAPPGKKNAVFVDDINMP